MAEIRGWTLADRFEVRDTQAMPGAKAVWRIPHDSDLERPQCVCVYPAAEMRLLAEALREAGF